MLADTAAAADGAGGGGAADPTTAYVQATFDSHAATVVQAACAPGKLRLTLDGVLFDFDHDNLQSGGDDVLAQVKRVAVDAYPSAHIVVEGHTDNVGTDAHNDDLSKRRANTVVSWMQAHGVAAARLEAKGYGKRWPRVPNTTDGNRAKNRRVEFIVLDQTAGAACKKVPETGKGVAVVAANVGSDHEKGAPPKGNGHAPPSTPAPLDPATPVAFSFHYNDKADSKDHLCFSFDPAWIPAGAPPMGYLKQDYSLHDGELVDHCPTENVIATCDFRAKIPRMEWYYQGMSDAMLAVRKEQCFGRYAAVAPAAAVAKPPGDGAHKYFGACDLRNAPEGNGRGTCIEYRDDANPIYFNVAKTQCPSAVVPRCPSTGMTGRCDQRGVITLYYVSIDAKAMRLACETTYGSWSQP